MKRFLLALVAIAVASFSLSAQTLLPNDPTVRVGKLDNGLTYYIKHNDKPAQRAEFYLATHVGAIQETPDQDGLAHFLEHMCFNGTKNLPGKTMLDYLQSIGASFGKNINAGTGVEQTTYMLNNIPVIREGIVDTCLLIMHDYSHFVTNDPAEIDAERGVIVEEWRTRRTADWRMFEKSLPYLYGDSKYATCTLIGSKENLLSFKPESLWNFYKTWYRPDLQAVIVVGDVDVDQIEQKIKELWKDIPAAENPTPKIMPEVPENAEPLVGIITDPEATSTSIQIVSRQAPMPAEYNAYDVGMMMDLSKWLVSSIFRERYGDITSKPNAPFISASSGLGSLTETCDAFFTNLSSKEGDAVNAMRAVLTEVEKVKRYGFTEGEFERAKANILSYYESAAEKSETRQNAEFVDLYIQNFFQHYPYMDPKQEYEIAKMILDQMNVDVLNQMVMGGMITDNNLSIIYTAPEKEGLVHPTAEELLAVMDEVKNAEIEANVETVSNEPLMDAKLKGSKVKKTSEGVFGTTVWTLKNGIEVYVRPSSEKKDEIIMSLEVPGGRSLIPTEEIANFEDNVWQLYLSNAGLSKFSESDLKKVLAGKNAYGSPYISAISHGYSGGSNNKDIETAFQLMYLYITAPRFVDEDFQVSLDKVKNILPNLIEQPNFKFQQHINEVLYANNPRVVSLSEELIDNADINVIEKNYRMLFGNLKGARMYIFGDVNLETLKPLVEKYVGSLPTAKKPLVAVDHNIDIVSGNVEDVFKVKMETPKGTAIMLYQGDMPYDSKTAMTMRYLQNCLDILYTKTIREDEGGTYGVSVYGNVSKTQFDEKFMLQIAFDTNPEVAQRLMDKVVEGLEDFAQNGPTQEQFNMTRENFLKELSENRISNRWWMNETQFTVRYGIDEATIEKELIESVTIEDVKNLAKTILEQPNFIDLLMLPE